MGRGKERCLWIFLCQFSAMCRMICWRRTRFRNCGDRAVEHCFFHIGELDLEKPDKVFLRLMQCAQAKELGLLLIENIERFPLPPQAKIPQMEVYFVQEHQQEILGSLEIQVEMDKDIPQHGYAYFGL